MGRAVRRELFYHRLKLLLLFRRQFRPDALVDLFHFLAHFRRDIGPDFAVPFLAFGDDFGNRRVLFRRQLERLVKVFDEIFPPDFR